MADATHIIHLVIPAALVLLTIGLWATGKVPEFLASLIFITLVIILKVAPPEIALSGFTSSALWLVLSGMIIGAAIKKVGLADRIGAVLAGALGGSWPQLVLGTVLMTYGLCFFMPSNMGRVTLLAPIVLALADKVGLVEGRRGRSGLMLIVGIGTYELSTSVLPANVPNLILTGVAEKVYGVHFTYMPYLLLHGPILGILKGGTLVALICTMFRDSVIPIVLKPVSTPLTSAEKRLSVILVVTLLCWMTDSLHGIEPAWVGLASATICLLPRFGFLTADEFGAALNMRTGLYVAGTLALAAVLSHTGLGDLLGKGVLTVLPLSPTHHAVDFVSLVGLTIALIFVATANSVPALFTPLGGVLAASTGLPLATVLMVQVFGYATPLMPYQAAPIVVAMSLGKVSNWDGTRLLLALAAVSLVVIMPIDYLWFTLLGWIP